MQISTASKINARYFKAIDCQLFKSAPLNYRREIDGLRAVAVLPVILFHAGFELFSGGFVGVDVFFVISGFLITNIILAEMEQGRFSIINFYERRARRIVPVLFLVMMLCVPAAWYLLLPSDLTDFAESLIAVPLFSSNILFWRETGYWGAVNELKPLLHTWSLAVEEQYYVLFPLFLMLLWRFSKRWVFGAFLFIVVFSLLLAEWAAYHQPSANFFLLPTRAWELGVGACIAFYFVFKKDVLRLAVSNRVIDETAGLIGIAMILFAVFGFDATTPFPSFYALLPTVGTGLIILFSSKNTLVGRLLGHKWLVGIGLLSYSAYLWHQPLFAFARNAALHEPTPTIFAVLTMVTLGLAYLSWRFVEAPFRKKDLFSRRFIFIFTLVGSIILIGLGVLGRASEQVDVRRISDGQLLRDIEAKTRINPGFSKHCDEKFTLSVDCRTDDNPEILLWGDSYAMHMAPAIVASNPNVKLIQMTKSACAPFSDVARVTSPQYPVAWGKRCLAFNKEVMTWLESSSVDYVVMSSPFGAYVTQDAELLSSSGDILKTNVDVAVDEFIKTLRKIEALGKTPVIISPPPANGRNLGKCLVRAEFFNISKDICNFSYGKLTNLRQTVYRFLDHIAREYRVIRLDDYLCQDAMCMTYIDDEFIYRDGGHLSVGGAKLIGTQMRLYDLITQPETINRGSMPTPN